MPAGGTTEASLVHAPARYAAAAPSRNTTLEAITDAALAEVDEPPAAGQVPFSSNRRRSALDQGDDRLVLGAPERFEEAGGDAALAVRAREEAEAGRRVLQLGRSAEELPGDTSAPAFPTDVEALGLVVLAERLRPSAGETTAFFTAEGIELKVLCSLVG